MKHRIAAALSSPATGACIGVLLGFSWLILGLASGSSVESVLFSFTLGIVYAALLLRTLVGILAFMGLGLLALSVVIGWRSYGTRFAGRIRWITAFVIGSLFPISLTFQLLNPKVFLDAFPSVAFVLGSLMLAGGIGNSLTHPVGFGRDGKSNIDRSQMPGLAALAATILLSLVLVTPNLIPVAGILPSPPDRPEEGYGSGETIFEVIHFERSASYPNSIAEWWPEEVESRDWKVHIFLPLSHEQDSLGLAVLLHGFEGEDVAYYEDTLHSLAGQGLIAIFPEYVSAVDYSSVPSDFNLERAHGGTNDPAHLPRYSMAMSGLESALELLKHDVEIVSALDNATVDLNHLWIGGHSMGAGTTLHVSSELLARGWGNGSLVLNLEAPWISALQDDLRGNMSLLPDHAQVHVVEYQDDAVVAPCIGRWHHDRISSRDGAEPLPLEQVRMIQVPSDRHGYPQLVASHYAQVTLLRDSLADRTYYPRIEAQADYVASMARDDLEGADSARYAFMEEEGVALDAGFWSDGTSVNSISFLASPLKDPTIDWSPCEGE